MIKYILNDGLYKIEIFMILFSMFFQSFAILNTNDFGIPFSFFVAIYIFFKLIYLKKINIRILIFIIIVLSFQFIIFFINKYYININKLIRFSVILFIYYNYFEYFKLNFGRYKKYIYKYTNRFIKFIVLYGIYSIFAIIYRFPLLLNIFNNSNSYNNRGLFDYVGGWVTLPRIYGTFFEPSSYGMFLVIIYFIYQKINKKPNRFINILILTNILFTFSRSAYVAFFYSLFLINIYNYLSKKLNNRFFKNNIIYIYTLPIINIYIMDFFTSIFLDSSSFGRTNSAFYYFINQIKNFPNLLFFIGNGLGSIGFFYDKNLYGLYFIESIPHNGIVEFFYEFGFIMLLLIFLLSFKYINKKNYPVLIIFFSIMSFESYYNVESFIIAFVFTYFVYSSNSLKEVKCV